MKISKIIPLALGTACSIALLSGCAAGFFEEEINVVFMNEGEVVDAGVITQFKNYKTPSISEAYIPSDFRFLGWTTYDTTELDYSDPTHFKSQYIGAGRMIHYMEAKPHAINSTVTYQALIMHKDDIPKEYHYAVMAWYNKPATSGITEDNMKWVGEHLNTYLTNQGVSKEDINSVVIRGYTGNVGPSTGQILYDGDVDIMFGWATNISTTGSIPEASILDNQTITVLYNGDPKTRNIHRLTDNPGALKVMDFLLSEEVTSYFNPGSAE